ncbi:pilus assembly protein PilW [Lysobacter xinjiangensis]|uniref:Pilus assembly protein PilW n=1 Tax=Cognatilysobacter xinjiangensis TaxID=546892 RepID=A0ABQ3BQZ1_9GAMM|nr:PilW family protein [Lysobacter xinjiangensis]GGZ54508.1 pilus assembly protein PilW [Lysobacter xinjiangensis]
MARLHRMDSRRVEGLSLVELMIALLIGSILMLGLVQVFSASRAAYQVSEGLARVQENGRFALDYLQRDLRLIGHFGCVNDQSHKQQVDAFRMLTGAVAGEPLDFNLSVQGFEATGTSQVNQDLNLAAPTAGWTPALPAHISGLAPVAGSDIIMLRFLRPNSAPVSNLVVSGSNSTVSTTAAGWSDLTEDGVATPGVFGVADCSYVDVFNGTGNAAAKTVSATVALDRYTPNPAGHAALYRAEAVAYYVANNASNRRSLFRARWTGAAAPVVEELVEGIESIQFLYGQDRSTDVGNPSGFMANQVPASDLGAATTTAGEQNWRRVGLVQVAVVASSPDPATTRQADSEQTRPRALGLRVVGPEDGRYRASYETTIALRNRLYGN